MRDSSTHPVHTHSSGLPPRPAASPSFSIIFPISVGYSGFNIIFATATHCFRCQLLSLFGHHCEFFWQETWTTVSGGSSQSQLTVMEPPPMTCIHSCQWNLEILCFWGDPVPGQCVRLCNCSCLKLNLHIQYQWHQLKEPFISSCCAKTLIRK